MLKLMSRIIGTSIVGDIIYFILNKLLTLDDPLVYDIIFIYPHFFFPRQFSIVSLDERIFLGNIILEGC